MTNFRRPSHYGSKSRNVSGGANIRFPSFEVFAHKHRRLTGVPGKERQLNKDEYAIAESIFNKAIDYTRVRVIKALIASSPTVLGDYIRVKKLDSISPPILIHELAHVWQYQTKGLKYISSSIWQQASTNFVVPKIKKGASIHTYTAEEQAEIISDYYVFIKYEKITSELEKKGKLLRNKAGNIALLPIAERKEIDLNDGEELGKKVVRVTTHKNDYIRMIAEVRKSRPLSKLQLKKYIDKDLYSPGTVIKPPEEERHKLQPNPLIRIEF